MRALLQDKYDGKRPSEALLQEDRERLAAGEPLAYVIGWIPYLGLRIHLDSHPLIPRPETEWWTEELIKTIAERYGGQAYTFLDLCSGSGAIGCAALKAGGSAQVSFGELDPAHEATIRKNIQENGLDASRARIGIGDLFAPFRDQRFDVIAANPPYIPSERALPESVTDFEPSVALFAGSDGLDIIRRIAIEAPNHLNPGGELWLECDAEHAAAVQTLLAATAKKAFIRTDPYGRPRLIVGYY